MLRDMLDFIEMTEKGRSWGVAMFEVMATRVFSDCWGLGFVLAMIRVIESFCRNLEILLLHAFKLKTLNK